MSIKHIMICQVTFTNMYVLHEAPCEVMKKLRLTVVIEMQQLYFLLPPTQKYSGSILSNILK